MTESDDRPRRRGGTRALGGLVAGQTRPLFRRRGFADGAVAADWAAIVGPHLAAHTQPEKVARTGPERAGTLHLAVAGGALALELAHLEPQIVERVNAYFGYRAIDRLKIAQRPLPPAALPSRPMAPRPGAEASTDWAPDLNTVDDPDLRAALTRLGRAIAAKRKPVAP